MNNFLKFPLNIQLFADDPTPAPNPEPSPAPVPSAQHPEIDYDKLASAIESRTSRKEEGIVKSYLKEQGLSEDEMKEALKAYKETKANKVKEEQERINKIIRENNEYKKKELMVQVTSEAKTIAKELNVREDRFDKLMALCDQKDFMDDKGVINKEAIKKEMEKQLQDLPEFKTKKQVTFTTPQNGNQTPPQMTDEEAYRKRKYGKNKYYRG
ncbi:hypothetical protein [Amedibacterium intestinale]|jgi:hypothetical protein|uniref:hypothetical protein n=1 Tax=Amedibacterium intestinale TaxID=2583452 RepID=UPI000E4A86B5|nr:hypothetical protein [Amedibacterium intestinale]RHO23796.1 hypothetical protein DW220_01960 [Eubacterium sp. AM18-26]RHO27890.1 hypothetical protein DW212_02495 [Eubacterium sp. AM18-10LB-B]DAU93646.1 MAG TPA: Major head protein [Caudoviricetes sp.]